MATQDKKFPSVKRNILLNPGPSTTTDTVKYAMVVPDICPREKEFGEVMKTLSEELVKIVHGDKAWEEYNAQILLDARKNAGITQQELADRIGANKGYISRIERGLIIPSVATLYRIAAAMGLSVELRPMG